MGGIGHAIGKVISAPFRAVGKLFGAKTSTASVTQSGGATPATPATPAAAAADAQNNDTNVDTAATKRKRKAAGKKSLMIGKGSDEAGGGTTGTGLNL